VSEGEHWSSPNGCHPDCPECAKEASAEHRRQTQGETVEALVQHLRDEGVTPDHLDDAVRDAAAERAAELLNDGLDAQVTFLLRGSDHSWKPGDIIATARRAKREAEAAVAVEKLKSEDLDGAVIEAASRMASNTNNDGRSSQLEFLRMAGWSDADILEFVEREGGGE
jgi:hypothetical protein